MDSRKLNINSRTIIFIAGPTASGKSSLAMDLAKRIGGEIICADSQTVRKGLDVGTAKPSKEDQAEVPHHMLDLIEPYEKFSVARFKQMAQLIIKQVQERGNIPIVVGGSGLYMDALFYDFEVDGSQQIDVQSKNQLEQKPGNELQEIITKNGWELPENQNNPRHLVGLILRNGHNYENVQPIEGAKMFVIQREREDLQQRIAGRIEQMLGAGLVEEVQKLQQEYGPVPEDFDAIDYSIFARYLKGEVNLAQAKEGLARKHWQYARRQIAWFKRNKFAQSLDSKGVSEPIIDSIIKSISVE